MHKEFRVRASQDEALKLLLIQGLQVLKVSLVQGLQVLKVSLGQGLQVLKVSLGQFLQVLNSAPVRDKTCLGLWNLQRGGESCHHAT